MGICSQRRFAWVWGQIFYGSRIEYLINLFGVFFVTGFGIFINGFRQEQ